MINIICIIIIIIVMWNLWNNRNFSMEHYRQTNPVFNINSNTQLQAYYSIPKKNDYLYAIQDINSIIPFEELDFTNPLHRWLYYYYPKYYGEHYLSFFPFEGDFYGYRITN